MADVSAPRPKGQQRLTPVSGAPSSCSILANNLLDKVTEGTMTPEAADEIFQRAGCYEPLPDDPEPGIFARIGGVLVKGGETALSLPKFLLLLTQRDTWIRIGQIIGGLILGYLAITMLRKEIK